MKRLCLSAVCLLGIGMASAGAQIVAPSPESKGVPATPFRPPPAAPAPTPLPYAPPLRPAPPAPIAPGGSSIGGNDPAALQVERMLPLDPATLNLQNQLPPNPGQIESQLGLREPVGPVTDLRGRIPTPQEIVNGLNRR